MLSGGMFVSPNTEPGDFFEIQCAANDRDWHTDLRQCPGALRRKPRFANRLEHARIWEKVNWHRTARAITPKVRPAIRS